MEGNIALAFCYSPSRVYIYTAKSNYTATRHTSIAKMATREVSSPEDTETHDLHQGLAGEPLPDEPLAAEALAAEFLPDDALAYLLPIDHVAQEVSSSANTGTHIPHQGLPDEAFAYFLSRNYSVDSTPQPPALPAAGLPALEQNSSVNSFADMATQEVSNSDNTHISDQARADEAIRAFTYLDVDNTPQLPPALPSAGLSAPGPSYSVTAAPYTSQYTSFPPPFHTAFPSGSQLPAYSPAQQPLPAAPTAPTAPPTPLPSLLQYTDTILMRTSHLHNNPPDSIRACTSCRSVWDNAKIPSTFLPLSPCGHWIHYRCLIWLATRDDKHHDKCPACKVVLFEVDGVGALTLAARTNVPMGDRALRLQEGRGRGDDEAEYEEQCEMIEGVIRDRFSRELARESGFGDGSPDLVRCFDGVVQEVGRPGARWLRWSTTTGQLLFCMLVAIKMRRFLLEEQSGVLGTEAWAAWEEGCQRLQRRVLEDVRMG